jgi:hypothetical protein
VLETNIKRFFESWKCRCSKIITASGFSKGLAKLNRVDTVDLPRCDTNVTLIESAFHGTP